MWEITCHILFFRGYTGTTLRRYGGILEEPMSHSGSNDVGVEK